MKIIFENIKLESKTEHGEEEKKLEINNFEIEISENSIDEMIKLLYLFNAKNQN